MAPERGALSGWGGPEETLRGPAALSVPPGRPRPSLNQPRDRVGQGATPSPLPCLCRLGGVGGSHLLAWRPWAWPSLVWAARPPQALWAADFLVEARRRGPASPPPGLLPRARPGSSSPNSACGDFGTPVAPLSPPAVRLDPIAWDWLMLLGAEVPPPCFLLSVWVGL